MSEHDEIRAHLERKREELLHRLDALKHDIRSARNPDFAEQATEREHDEVLDALDGASRTELAAIDRALGRIDRGEYGLCVECGARIPERRLEILPYSDHCIRCAEKAS